MLVFFRYVRQAGMPNVLEESPNVVTDYYHTRNKKDKFRLRQRLRVNRRTTNCHQLICVLIIIRHFVRGEAERLFFNRAEYPPSCRWFGNICLSLIN